MAQKVQVLLVDDIDGGTADETVTFGLDGVTYEIDLTSGHASELRDAFAQWVGHARKVGGRTAAKSTAARGRRSSSSDAQAIREWAKEHGHHVSERGRISAEVKAAYDASHRHISHERREPGPGGVPGSRHVRFRRVARPSARAPRRTARGPERPGLR